VKNAGSMWNGRWRVLNGGSGQMRADVAIPRECRREDELREGSPQSAARLVE